MIRMIWLIAFFFVLFMWSANSALLEDAPILMRVGLHGAFGTMALFCVISFVRGE